MNKGKSCFSNSEIAIISIYLLGGNLNFIDVEDIAVKAFEIAPIQFGWKKFPEQNDKTVTIFALKDIKKIYKNILIGSFKKGFMLNNEGISIAEDLLTKIDDNFKSFVQNKRRESSDYKNDLEKMRLIKTTAYLKFLDNNLDNISERDFYDFLKANEYFPEHLLRKRISIIESIVEDDLKLKSLWLFLKNSFVTK